MKIRYYMSAATVMATVMAASPAFAQQADSDGPAEVVITATKRAQTLIEVPGAIGAIGGDDLQDRGVTQATDLQTLVPSLQAGQGRSGDTAIAIRGVGLTVTGSAPGVAVHVDGVYQPRPSMGELTQVDLERVEVLRGPQGTTYGRNANGGVINFITKAPTQDFGGYVLASYQNYDEYRVQGALNVPITDSVRLRVSGDRWQRGDGLVTNLAANGPELDKGDSWMARAHLEVDLASNFTASLIGTYAQRDGTFVYYTNVDQPIAQARVFTPSLTLPTTLIPNEPRTVAINDPVSQERRYTSVAGILNWDMGDVTIKSTTAYQRFRDDFQGDFDATNVSLAVNTTKQLAKTFTQELTIGINKGPVHAVLGGFYMRDEFRFHLDFEFPNGARLIGTTPQQAAPAGAGLQQLAKPYTTKTLAFFGDVTLDLSDSFRLIGGLRYSSDKQTITQDSFQQFPALPPAFGPVASPAADANGRVIATLAGPIAQLNRTNSQSFSSWTPRFGFQYDVTPDNVIYGSFSKGFKVGGFNFRTSINDRYASEELTAYELGIKNEFAKGKFTLNASAFYYDYKNMQVEQLVGFNFLLANAPKARIYGAEFETVMRPSKSLTVNANMTLSNARFTEFSNTDILATPLGGSATLQDLSGNPIPNAPDVSVNVGFDYRTQPVIAGGSLTFRSDLGFKSRVFFREFNNVADSQPAYAVLSSSVQWSSADDRYSVRIYGKNLTNEDYLISLAQTSFVGNRFGLWGAPRQYGVELRTRF